MWAVEWIVCCSVLIPGIIEDLRSFGDACVVILKTCSLGKEDEDNAVPVLGEMPSTLLVL